MGYKTLEQRREHYEKNKDKINAKRREHAKKPGVRERKAAEFKKWRENNLERAKEISKKAKKKYDIKIKKQVFEHYGKKCLCCGEDNIIFLTIDHIRGNGTQHRKKINNQSYIWLVKNNFPEEFQTLCFNCNWGKHINGGICPHKKNN